MNVVTGESALAASMTNCDIYLNILVLNVSKFYQDFSPDNKLIFKFNPVINLCHEMWVSGDFFEDLGSYTIQFILMHNLFPEQYPN